MSRPWRRSGAFALAFGALAAGHPAPPVLAQGFTLRDVSVLSGCWAGRTGTVLLREQWTEAVGGVVLGNTRYLRDGAVVDWEFGRIAEDSTGVTLWPYPRGVMSPRGFPLVRADSALVFENLEHDFPVRIIYARDADVAGRLRVRIEGHDGDGPSWTVDRVPCSDELAREASSVFRIERLVDGVYAAVVLPDPDAYAFANSLVVVGERGVLVVDTQQSPRAARALIREIETLTDLPVRWIVNTHWHGDHVNGNAAYRARWPDVEILATRQTVEGMRGRGAEMRAEELERLPGEIREREGWLEAGRLPDGRELDADLRRRVEQSVRLRHAYHGELRALEAVYPTRLVDQRTSIDLGGKTVALVPVGSAHTEGDLTVFVEGERILAVGDLLEEAAPWIDGADLAGWADALRLLQSLDPVTVLAAHAGGARGPAQLDRQAALFGDLVRLAREAAGRPEPVGHVRAGLEAHRAFLGELGVSGAAFDAWASDAAELALEQAR